MKLRRDIIFCVLLSVATALVFGIAGRYDYIEFDDDVYVFDNPVVKKGLTSEGLVWAFTTGFKGNYTPLAWLSHMADVAVFGNNPGGHHVTSIVFHIINAILVFIVLRLYFGSFLKSAFAAVLFALHPLRVESVAWIAERKDVLSALFFFSALIAYHRYVMKHGAVRFGLVLFFLLLGLLSKSMVVTLPFVLILLDIWPLRRVKIGADGLAGIGKMTSSLQFRRIALEKIPMIAFGMIIGVIAFAAQHTSGAISDIAECPYGVRVENALVAYCMYVIKIIWPSKLGVLYPHPGGYLPIWKVVAALGVLIAVTVASIKYIRRYPFFFVGWLWFVMTLAPVIGIIQFGAHAMADRFTYIPSIGLLIVVVWGAEEFAGKSLFRQRALVAAGAVAAVAYTIVTWQQIHYWKDSETLFRRTLAVTSFNHVMENNLGCVLNKKGKKQEALQHFRGAVAIKSDYIDARLNYAGVLSDFDRRAEALRILEESVKLAPNEAKVHDRLGVELAAQGRSKEALSCFGKALELDPGMVEAHNNIGVELERTGKYDEALDHYTTALAANPESVETINNVANLYLSQKQYDKAEEFYLKAVGIDPDFYRAHFNLGILYTASGRNEEALHEYRESLRINPKLAEAHNQIATIFAAEGKLYEAAEQLRIALKISPGYQDALNNLDAVLNALQQ